MVGAAHWPLWRSSQQPFFTELFFSGLYIADKGVICWSGAQPESCYWGGALCHGAVRVQDQQATQQAVCYNKSLCHEASRVLKET